jgi:hypothetical protein
VFIYQHVLPTFLPAFEPGDYGFGYRSGSQINQLENENTELREIIRAFAIKAEVEKETDGMTDEEIISDLRRNGWLSDDEPSRAEPMLRPSIGR